MPAEVESVGVTDGSAEVESVGVTDGLTLLRKLRESGTPEGVWKLALPVLHADPLADAEAVYTELAKYHENGEGRVQANTLHKARSLIETGDLPIPPALIDPLEEIAAARGGL